MKRKCRCGNHILNLNIYGKYATIKVMEFYETKNYEVKDYFSKHSLTKCVY